MILSIRSWTRSWSQFGIDKYRFWHGDLLSWKELSSFVFGPIIPGWILIWWFLKLHLFYIFIHVIVSNWLLRCCNTGNFVQWFKSIRLLDIITIHSKLWAVNCESLFISGFNHFIDSIWLKISRFVSFVHWIEIIVVYSHRFCESSKVQTILGLIHFIYETTLKTSLVIRAEWTSCVFKWSTSCSQSIWRIIIWPTLKLNFSLKQVGITKCVSSILIYCLKCFILFFVN